MAKPKVISLESVIEGVFEAMNDPQCQGIVQEWNVVENKRKALRERLTRLQGQINALNTELTEVNQLQDEYDAEAHRVASSLEARIIELDDQWHDAAEIEVEEGPTEGVHDTERDEPEDQEATA